VPRGPHVRSLVVLVRPLVPPHAKRKAAWEGRIVVLQAPLTGTPLDTNRPEGRRHQHLADGLLAPGRTAARCLAAAGRQGS
jgi:hypothetical protein